jgi:hypothetical protein
VIGRLRPALGWLVSLTLFGSPADAVSDGITGFSGKLGDTCADSCHGPAVPPVVAFEGPTEVEVGELATFRFVVRSQSPQQPFAGFNVAVTDGVLDVWPGEGARLEVGELTHEMPKTGMDGEVSWDFLWKAPAEPGIAVLFGAGLSANGTGTRDGDDGATTVLHVLVRPLPQAGDANCDGRLSAADLTVLVMFLDGGAPDACSLADANCDGGIDERDLAVVTARLFEPLAATPCS